ncbi:MAG: XrtA system polysaccharide deacetylase [Pseudomonadota bacterium]
MEHRVLNAMSVDVEDFFQVSAFEQVISRDDWDSIAPRVERNTQVVLDLFDNAGVHATFFTLGWVAERFPGLIRDICARGHELASHGMSHVRATQQTRAEFAADVQRTKALLEDISGTAVDGYRAASFSIATSNLWAHDELVDAGYTYSSSIYPVRHDLYGMPAAPRFSFRVQGSGILEIPITTTLLAGHNLPCGGGGYFRLLPYAYSKWAISRVNRDEGESAVFYFHPWEIDPGQPRQSPIGLKTAVRHYTNLNVMARKLERLCQDFQWGSMREVFVERDRVSPCVALSPIPAAA